MSEKKIKMYELSVTLVSATSPQVFWTNVPSNLNISAKFSDIYRDIAPKNIFNFRLIWNDVSTGCYNFQLTISLTGVLAN